MRVAVAVFALIAAVAVVLFGRDRGAPDPCETPLGWKLGEVRGGGSLTETELRDAVEAAARPWNRAGERRFLRHDPDDGMPIHFHLRKAQGKAREIREGMGDLGNLQSELGARQEDIERERARLEEKARAIEKRTAELERELRAHREDLLAHRRGEADAPSAGALERTGERLREARDRLRRRKARLRDRRERLQEDIQAYNRKADELNSKSGRLESQARAKRDEPGVYRETRGRTLLGSEMVLDREIFLYFFYNDNHMRRTLTHELGHALGIGHVDEPGAVMHASYEAQEVLTGRAADSLRLHAADLEALDALCP